MKKLIDDKTKCLAGKRLVDFSARNGVRRCIYSESLCNPGGVIIDLKKVAEIAHAAGIPLIVDNTSATPCALAVHESDTSEGADRCPRSTRRRGRGAS